MIVLYLLHALTLIVLLLILWGLDKLVLHLHLLHEYIRSVAEVEESPPPAPMQSVPPHPVKCRVDGCGWPAVDENFCDEHVRSAANEY